MGKGIGIFDGQSEQDVRDAANPGATVHIDGRTESLAAGIHKAALMTVGQAVPTPYEAMQKEHGRLLAAFREAEGRDPDPNADPEFWKAYGTILDARTGVTKSRGARRFGANTEDGSTLVRKDNADDLAERISKALGDGSAPAWLPGLLERNR